MYQEARARSGSPKEMRSVTEQLEFLQGAVLVWDDKAAAQAVSESLERILRLLRT